MTKEKLQGKWPSLIVLGINIICFLFVILDQALTRRQYFVENEILSQLTSTCWSFPVILMSGNRKKKKTAKRPENGWVSLTKTDKRIQATCDFDSKTPQNRSVFQGESFIWLSPPEWKHLFTPLDCSRFLSEKERETRREVRKKEEAEATNQTCGEQRLVETGVARWNLPEQSASSKRRIPDTGMDDLPSS